MLKRGHWPCIRNQDINKLPIEFINCISRVDTDNLEKLAVFIQRGTIVMSDMGTEKGLGSACAYMGHESPIIGNSVVAIKHNENPVFLAHVINSPFVREQVTRKMKGTIVQHLRAQDLRNLEIPCPDIETQNKVAEVIRDMDKCLNDMNSACVSYQQLYELTCQKILSND